MGTKQVVFTIQTASGPVTLAKSTWHDQKGRFLPNTRGPLTHKARQVEKHRHVEQQLEDVTKMLGVDPESLDAHTLLKAHLNIHQIYPSVRASGRNVEDFIRHHATLVQQFSKAHLEHKSLTDLDKSSHDLVKQLLSTQALGSMGGGTGVLSPQVGGGGKFPPNAKVKRKKLKIEYTPMQKAEEKRFTLGVAYPANDTDAHGEYADEQTVEDAAHWFMQYGLEPGKMHMTDAHGNGIGRIVESYIYRNPVPWQMGNQTVKKGDWVAGAVWEPSSWQEIKLGKLTGFSIDGTALRVPVEGNSGLGF